MDHEVTSTVHCDLEGRITFMSEGAQEIFQYCSEEMVGKERVSIFSPGLVVLEHVPTWLKKSVEDGHYETDTVFLRKDGSEFAAHIRITPIIKDGVHTGFIGLTTPLPDRDSVEVEPQISLATNIMKWLFITRSPFLTVTIVPVLIGGFIAQWLVPGTDFSVGLLLLTLLGACLAHLGANTANDYFDWRSGADAANPNYIVPLSGGSRMIQLGVISPRGTLITSVTLFAMAAAIGAYLATAAEVWPEMAGVAVAGAALGFFYTAPPIRLVTRGLGELGIILAFGPLIVVGAVMVQTGTFEPEALLIGLPTGILTGLIIWVNQIPDAPGDEAGGKHTLVVRLGIPISSWLYIVLWVSAFGVIVGLFMADILPAEALLGLLTIPLAVIVSRQLFLNLRSREIKKAMAGTIMLHLATGLLLALGAGLTL